MKCPGEQKKTRGNGERGARNGTMLSASSAFSSSSLLFSSLQQRLMLPASLPRSLSSERTRVPARRSPICSRNAEHGRSLGTHVVVKQHGIVHLALSRVRELSHSRSRVILPVIIRASRLLYLLTYCEHFLQLCIQLCT